MNKKDTKTFNNLAKAYVGESCARGRYNMLAELAKKNGYVAMSDLIKLIENNEFQHSRMIYSFLCSMDKNIIDNIDMSIGIPFKERPHSLEQNLKFSAEDEGFEVTKIYPEFEKVAREEGFEDIANFFKNLIQVETCHQSTFTQLHDQLTQGTMYKKPKATKWKCGSCGYEHTAKEAWTNCPLCGAPQGTVLIEITE